MTPQVHFTRLTRPDRVEGIAHLLLRRNRMEPAVLVICPDDPTAHRLDQRLWTIHPESFLAHALHGAPNMTAMEQPILIATEVVRDNDPKVLINAGLEIPPDLNGFEHIVDFVDAWDKTLVQTARARWRTYKSLGMEPKYLPGERKEHT